MLFTTKANPITLAVIPYLHSVTNVSDHEITVRAISSHPDVVEVLPLTRAIAPHKSVDFSLIARRPEDRVAGHGPTCTVTFSSGGESISVLVSIAEEALFPRGHCFAGETLVLLADGSARAIAELQVGESLLTACEIDHLVAQPKIATAKIEAVLRHDTERAMLDLGGLRVTPNHRWAVRDPREPGFATTESLDRARHELLGLARGQVAWLAVPAVAPAGSVATVWNLTTSAQTYAVARTADGPFLVVHNSKPHDGRSVPDEELDPALKPE